MDTEWKKIHRLKEEQQSALDDTNNRINKLQEFAKDYQSLQRKLTELPEKLTHNITVPFGKYAFMPGQLVHTNEVLVLLGDNWFAERSAKQAVDIAGRRIASLREQITNLEKQRELLEPRLDFTSHLDSLHDERQDMFEIKEDFDETEEAEWAAKHRESVRNHKMALRQEKENPPVLPGGATRKTDAELWKRLEELEHQESRNREMERDEFADEKVNVGQSPRTVSKQSIRWEDEADLDQSGSTDEDEEDLDRSTDEDDEIDESNSVVLPSTITFVHSKTEEKDEEFVSPHKGAAPITSPEDIYKAFVKPALDKPRPILKQTATTESVDRGPQEEQEVSGPVKGVTPPETSKSNAFSGLVVEKDLGEPHPTPVPYGEQVQHHHPIVVPPSEQVQQYPPLQEEEDPRQQPKRVSRFKAHRMKKD